jgi:hypothetical protein
MHVPIFDADNHLYETKDALTKFLPDQQERTQSRAPQTYSIMRACGLPHHACVERSVPATPCAPTSAAAAKGRSSRSNLSRGGTPSM